MSLISEKSVDTNTWRTVGNLLGRPFAAASGTIATLVAALVSKLCDTEVFHNRCNPVYCREPATIRSAPSSLAISANRSSVRPT